MSLVDAEASGRDVERSVERWRGGGRRRWARLRGDPSFLVGAVIVGGFVLVAVFAPMLAPHDPAEGDLARIRPGFVPGPSAEHLLGLDQEGRDELSRLIHGARYSLVVGVASVVLGLLLGSAVGAVAAGVGGWVDTVLMRVMDVMLAIPGLLFAIGIAAALGPSLISVTVAIGVTAIPVVARLLRSTMLAQREADYALAARAVGVRRTRIVVRHVLLNSLNPVIVAGTLAVSGAILEAAGLSFLGLGPNDPSVPEWGRMLAETQRSLQFAPQLVLFPGAAIVLVVVGFNLLGDALREALDPKIRR